MNTQYQIPSHDGFDELATIHWANEKPKSFITDQVLLGVSLLVLTSIVGLVLNF